jgi:spermidine synthase
MSRPWGPIVASDACSFTAGCATALVQVTLVRELFGALEGHEVSIALSLAVWVAGIAFGALAAGRLASGRRVDTGHLVFAAALLALAAFGGLALLRDGRTLLDIPRGGAVGIGGSALLAALGVGPAALMAGAFLPLYVRVTETDRGLRCGPSRFYALDAAGTALGGALAPFLVSWAPAPRLVGVFASFAAAAPAVAAAMGLARPRRSSGWLGAAGLGVLAALALVADTFEASTQQLRRASLGVTGELGAPVESPYERLDVAGRAGGRGQVTVLGNGTVVAVAPDPYGAGVTLDFVLCEHPAPRDVLVVGSSPSDAVRTALAHGAASVTLATFDPWVLHELHQALAPADRAWLDRGHVLAVDARAHLREAPAASYDLIALFAPEPLTALANRFYTREAFRDAARVLRPGGVLALQLPWSANAPDASTIAYGRSVVRALRDSFPYLTAMPGIDTILFASRDPRAATTDPQELARRAASRPGLVGRPYPADLFAETFPPDQLARLNAQLGLDHALPGPVNEDLRPVAYLDRMLAHLTRGSTSLATKQASRLPAFLGVLTSFPPWAVALPMLLAPLAAWFLRRRPEAGERAEAFCLAAFVGGSGMALEMLLLVAYQVDTGRLYVGYALLTGAFMLGLATGTYSGERLLRRPGWGPRAALARIETLAAVVLIGAWAAVPLLAENATLLVACSIAAGLLTGVPFPALVGAARPGRPNTRAGAWALAGDNLGACVGALVATLVLLPAHGLAASLLLLAAARGCGALTAAIRSRS